MIFRRAADWPNDRLAKVERAWDGETAVCIATGPSLTAEQVEVVRRAGARTIAVNDAYLLAPFADVAYFADVKWWNWHKDRAEWKSFAGEKCSIFVGGNQKTSTASEAAVNLLMNASAMGFSSDPGSICTGSNSGYQAINIAILAGARRVVLIGYDCKATDRDHFFGAHPDKSRPPFETIRQRFRETIEPARKMGVEILNATPGSALDAYPRIGLAESLEPAARPAVV